MAAVWIIVAKTRFAAELIESSREHGVKSVSIPFEMSAEYVPELFRGPDRDLSALASGEVPTPSTFGDIVYRSETMARAIAKAKKAAVRNVPILIEGESGTGKELLARAIHNASPRHSKPRWADGSRAWDILNTESQAFLDRVNDWIAIDYRFETGYALMRRNYKEVDEWEYLTGLLNRSDAEENLDEVKRLLEHAPTVTRLGILDERTRATVHVRDIGVGISQLLPVVVAALETRRGIVAVEQPELHLHPKTQMGFGDLFASRIREADVMFLIETHSEHLMLRILRRIRETTDGELPPDTFPLTPNDISVYFAHIPDDQTVLKRLRIREDGEFIDKWPKGFFEERAEELF